MHRAWVFSYAGLLGFLVFVYLFLTYGLPLVLPFVIAIIVAELMDPMVNLLSFKGKVPRSIGVAVVLLTFVGLILTAVTVGISRLVHEIQVVITQMPYLYSTGVDLVERFALQFGAFHDSLPDSIKLLLTQNLATIQKNMADMLPSVAGTLGAVSGLPVFLANMLVALIATFFISRDRREINAFLISLFPGAWQPKLREVRVEVLTSSVGYAKAQLVLILLTMTQTIIGLWVIGSDYVVITGIIVGVADILPVLGPVTVFLPMIIYQLIIGGTAMAIKLAILYALVAGVRQILEAKVVGDQIGLHPLTILVAMYLGFQFFGALGFVVGPLIAIVLKAMLNSGLLPAIQESPK